MNSQALTLGTLGTETLATLAWAEYRWVALGILAFVGGYLVWDHLWLSSQRKHTQTQSGDKAERKKWGW